MEALDHGPCLPRRQVRRHRGGRLRGRKQYAQEREAFGRPLSKFQAIRFKLAEHGHQIEAAKSLAYRPHGSTRTAKPCVKEASMAKYYSAQVADAVCREAVQIHGGYGYIVEYRSSGTTATPSWPPSPRAPARSSS